MEQKENAEKQPTTIVNKKPNWKCQLRACLKIRSGAVLAVLIAVASAGQPKTAAGEPVTTYNRFQEVPLQSVEPQGWIKEFLLRQKSGLTGHRKALGYPFDTGLWSAPIPRDMGQGPSWWRYEQAAFLTDGLLRLGYLLRDPDLIKDGQGQVDFVLSHPLECGALGFQLPGQWPLSTQWPFSVFMRAIQAKYSMTGDASIIEALHKHYLAYPVEDLVDGRNTVSNEGILWIYGLTGDSKLLDKAEQGYAKFANGLNMKECLSPNKSGMHGATYMEESPLPTIFYNYTGKQKYLDAATNAIKKLDRDHMLLDGVPSSNEPLAGKNPLMSHETCDISDYTWSVGYLLEATGDATWADHIEKAVFNAGPGCVSKDFKNLQYFSSVNQVIATGESNHNKYNHGANWMQYRPVHEVQCCAGNVNRFMPNYVARMWMRDRDGGLVAALYGPSVETISLEGGANKLTVTESTDYPFSDKIIFTFDAQKPVVIPFSFRIPGWCKKPQVGVNGKVWSGALASGTFVTIKREFKTGDRIAVTLPMEVNLVKWENFGVAVERGPLLFSFAAPEKVTVDTKVYPNLRHFHQDQLFDPEFPALDLRPSGPWNYALAVDPAKVAAQIQVVEKKVEGYPLDANSVPITLKVPARRVDKWELVSNRFTPELPKPGEFTCSEKVEIIDLVPYGSTRLRLSVFPAAEPVK